MGKLNSNQIDIIETLKLLMSEIKDNDFEYMLKNLLRLNLQYKRTTFDYQVIILILQDLEKSGSYNFVTQNPQGKDS